MVASYGNHGGLQGNDDFPISVGRRRRPRPSTSFSPARQRQYAIVLNSSRPISEADSIISPAAKGSLVQITRLPVNEGQPKPTPNDCHGGLLLCLYEATNPTQVDVDTKLTDAGDSDVSSILKCNFPANCTSIVSADDSIIDCTQSECLEFLQVTIASWYSRKCSNFQLKKNESYSIQREDVENLCNSLGPCVRSQNPYYHYCTCNNESCIADAVITSLGIDDIISDSDENRGNSQQQIISNPQHEKFQKQLRVMAAKNLQGHTLNNYNDLGNETSSGQDLPPYSTPNNGLVTFLPSSTKIPLMEITLCQNDQNITSGSDVTTDPLLRACVKRLFVGRVLVHSDITVESRVQGDVVSAGTLLFRSSLTIKVPHNPSPGDKTGCTSLGFRVADAKKTGVQPSSNDARLPSVFVILPSTRIIFQSCEENKQPTQARDEQEQSTKHVPELQPITQTPSFISPTSQTPMEPHQHIVESLRSIIFSKSIGEKLPIPRSFLFSGPPGVGKTFSVKKALDIVNSWLDNPATTTETKENNAVHLLSLRGSELLATASSSGGNYATAAKELERQFQKALNLCRVACNKPSPEVAKAVIVFLDECDALVSSSVVAAMLAVILDKMEGVIGSNEANYGWERLIVIAATNRVDAIPSFLRTPGRLGKEVAVNPPNADERFTLLKSLLRSHEPAATISRSFVSVSDADLQKVAEACVGYVAADLSALVRRAAILSIEDMCHNQNSSSNGHFQDHPMITAQDLISAMNDVGASCLRDASLSAPPKTTFDDIAGDAGGAKRALQEAIEWPRTRKKAFKALGLSPPRGVILHGPPGCAKTTLARAAAGAAGVAFLSLSPADVYASSYVGDAEGIVRRAFDLARSAAPCVLFFDEIDAIIGREDEGGGNKHGMGRGTSAEARVLSTFLNEMDGVDGSVEDGVLVLGATNRPGMLDAALLRPGRFDRVIYVPPPDEAGRKAILSMECKKWLDGFLAYVSFASADKPPCDISEYFDLDILASDAVSGLMTGAEIVGACRETAFQVLRTLMESNADLDGTPSNIIAKGHMESLVKTLESTLRGTTPLLSNAEVLEEYTRFENERN